MRKKGEDSIFAPTPPLESLRAVLSLAATPTLWMKSVPSSTGPNRMQICAIDISRAFFNAEIHSDQPVYVHLPPEDQDFGKGLGERSLGDPPRGGPLDCHTEIC